MHKGTKKKSKFSLCNNVGNTKTGFSIHIYSHVIVTHVAYVLQQLGNGSILYSHTWTFQKTFWKSYIFSYKSENIEVCVQNQSIHVRRCT